MKCEIEFLPVGEASSAGDAIVVRYEVPNNMYRLMVIDGGTEQSGHEIVEHLRAAYGPNTVVNEMVLTHSDTDHACGLRTVLEEMRVETIYLHVPWFHVQDAIDFGVFQKKDWTKEGLERAIRKEYSIINDIVELAVKQGCQIHSAFEGQEIGPFTVLSPSLVRYLYLLPQFDKTPEPDQDVIESAGMWIGKASLVARAFEVLSRGAEKFIEESWENERLRDGGITSASNESSLVLYANNPDHRALLTGDAGINALAWAADYAIHRGLPLQQFKFVQIPHHGSRRNVGPTILDILLGPKLAQATKHFSAYVSAPKDDSKHPRKIVLNAFMRRGAKVVATQGRKKVYWGGYSARPNYVSVEPLPFSETVEDYD